jgi:Ran GTPase-activating protein (RanGAP) involved in mRNA processing and transport
MSFPPLEANPSFALSPRHRYIQGKKEGLNLSSKRINTYEAKKVAEELVTNTILKFLCLGHNSIGDEGAVALANAVDTNMSLTYLQLDDNAIGDAGMDAFGKALKLIRWSHSASRETSLA